MIVVLTTVSNPEAGHSLAEKLVSNRLAACVQVLPAMTSFYEWKGELQKEAEHLLLIKTLEEKFDELSQFIAENHEYDVPEIVAIEGEKVSEPYRAWLDGVIGG